METLAIIAVFIIVLTPIIVKILPEKKHKEEESDWGI